LKQDNPLNLSNPTKSSGKRLASSSKNPESPQRLEWILMDIEAFSAAYFEFERAHQLPQWRIKLPDGHQFAPWPVIRFELFKEATQLAGLYDWMRDAPEPVKVANTSAGAAANRELLNWLGFSSGLKAAVKRALPSAGLGQLVNAKYLVVPFYRRDPAGKDKFTDFISEELGNEVGVIGSSPFDAAKGLVRYTALNKFARENLASAAGSKLAESVTEADIQRLNAAVTFCETSLGVKLETNRDWPTELFTNFVAEFDFWSVFFGKTKAKQLILPFTGVMSLIGAARAKGLRVSEVQHGLFNPYPMRFNWPGSPEVPYLPDEVWTWGDFWTRGFELAGGQVVKVMGRNASLATALSRAFTKKDNQITFVAQPAGAEELFEAAKLTAKAYPNKEIIFRLHPGDQGTRFIAAIENESHTNLCVSTTSPDILTLLAESAVVVGLFSTTLIEAAALGTPSVVLKLSSWARLKGLIDAGDAVLAENIADVPQAIETAKLTNSTDFYYAQPRTLRALLEL
jgi:hypothetical protein